MDLNDIYHISNKEFIHSQNHYDGDSQSTRFATPSGSDSDADLFCENPCFWKVFGDLEARSESCFTLEHGTREDWRVSISLILSSIYAVRACGVGVFQAGTLLEQESLKWGKKGQKKQS